MVKHKLREGEAHLLIALFDHLKIYDERAKTKDTSIADEMNNAEEHGCETYGELLNKAVINSLNTRERTIIILHYGLSADGECHTLEEIARALNVTCAYIHEHEDLALKRVKQYMTELNDEETDEVVYNLQSDVQEYLMDATRARVAGDAVSEEVSDHYWEVGTDAINKLKIQQAIRKYREGDERRYGNTHL